MREGDNSFTRLGRRARRKTGNYKNHFQIVKKDWHDWDVSNPPILIQTRGGKQLMAVAPKDGYLYGFDLATNSCSTACRSPGSRMSPCLFRPAPMSIFVRARWGARNGTAPPTIRRTNLIMVGEVEWCDTVTLQSIEKLRSVPIGQPWVGMAALNPFNMFGKEDRTWAGMGLRRRRRHRRLEVAPEGQLPDSQRHDSDGRRRRVLRRYGRQFYALDSSNGEKLRGQHLGGAIGGGVITYTANGAQKVAAAVGVVMAACTTILAFTRFASASDTIAN